MDRHQDEDWVEMLLNMEDVGNMIRKRSGSGGDSASRYDARGSRCTRMYSFCIDSMRKRITPSQSFHTFVLALPRIHTLATSTLPAFVRYGERVLPSLWSWI